MSNFMPDPHDVIKDAAVDCEGCLREADKHDREGYPMLAAMARADAAEFSAQAFRFATRIGATP